VCVFSQHGREKKMKIGVCLEMFFQDSPFLDRIAKAADAGCKYAEMWFTDCTADSPDSMNERDPKDAAKVAAAAAKAGVTMTNVVIGSPDGGIGGGLTDPSKRDEWLKRTDETLAFCKDAGVGACIVCTGNVVPGLDAKTMKQSVVDGLKATVEKAEAADIDLWIEPLNDAIDHADYFCTGSDQGAEVCREIGSDRLKILFDCYHMQIMEGDLVGHIKRNLDVIGHFHSAGHPERHELWLGETNYPFLAREIEKMGYSGVFALEYFPTIDAGESLAKTLAYLQD